MIHTSFVLNTGLQSNSEKRYNEGAPPPQAAPQVDEAPPEIIPEVDESTSEPAQE